MTQPVTEKRQVEPVRISVLKNRQDFLRVAAARSKWVAPGMILQVAAMPDPGDEAGIRVGYTASRKVGNAVKRARAKRRLREVVRRSLAARGRAGHDYVLIARTATVDLPFDQLIRDFNWCLKRLHAAEKEKKPAKAGGKSRGKPDSTPSGEGKT